MSAKIDSSDPKMIKDSKFITAIAVIVVLLLVGLASLYLYSSRASITERVTNVYNVEVVKHVEGRGPHKIIIREDGVTKECFTPTNEQMNSKSPLLCSVLETIQSK